jgi:hypothetical protein
MTETGSRPNIQTINIIWDIETFGFRICFGFRVSDFEFLDELI